MDIEVSDVTLGAKDEFIVNVLTTAEAEAHLVISMQHHVVLDEALGAVEDGEHALLHADLFLGIAPGRWEFFALRGVALAVFGMVQRDAAFGVCETALRNTIGRGFGHGGCAWDDGAFAGSLAVGAGGGCVFAVLIIVVVDLVLTEVCW